MIRGFTWLVLIIMALNSLFAKDRPTLIFYCGITMVKPMQKISNIIEKRENCVIKILQGGSQDLYDSLSTSKVGDLYLPGSDAYIKKYKKFGFFGKSVYVGYNQAAIFVQKGNPKKIKSLDNLLDKNISTMIGDPDSGSIGKNTKKILIAYKGENFFQKVYENAVRLGTDSRDINSALIYKDIDMAINWRASAFWDENSPYIDIINIDEKYAHKRRLLLTELTFSKHKDIVKKFLEFAASKEGKDIMKRYGFR